MRLCCPRQPFQIERPCQEWRTRSRAPFVRAPAGAEFPALGRRHSCLRLRRRPAPRDKHGFHGTTDLLRQGVHSRQAGRAVVGAGQSAPSCPARARYAPRRGVLRDRGRTTAGRRFAVNPERPDGLRGQNRNLSLISVAERNQHRHSMTPGRLAAVKDRGCPPILTCCGYCLASKNRLPPRPLLAAAARARRRP